MKMVRAIIQPHRLDMVRDALQQLGVAGMTAFQVQGFGRQKGHKEVYRGAEYTVHFTPKNLLEIVIEDGQVDDVCKTIEKTAKTGNIGDGKIFVLNVEKALRIRTGEVNESAL